MTQKTLENGDTATLKKRKRVHDDGRNLKRRRSSKADVLVAKGHTKESENELEEVNLQLQREEEERRQLLPTRAVKPFGRGNPRGWKISKATGGRMLDIDPIFSSDEKHLILAYNTSVQVYSTENSLLVRRIALQLLSLDEKRNPMPVDIVSAALSKTTSELLWVAGSDGRIWRINWTTGEGADGPFTVIDCDITDVAVTQMKIKTTQKDVVLVLAKSNSDASSRIFAFDEDALRFRTGKLIHTTPGLPGLLRATHNGRVIAAIAADALQFGYLGTRDDIESLDSLKYKFYAVEIGTPVTCLDLRERMTRRASKGKSKTLMTVDLAIGHASGHINLYDDLVNRLEQKMKDPFKPRKLHWHRRAVNCVKWNKDGNYLLSGGSEAALVLWQLDTGSRDFLPHLSASLENITVSPQGSSYALHLDDNSAMVISTAEMKPTTYISGIQSLALRTASKNSLLRRVWQGVTEVAAPAVSTSHPADASLILVCVGSGLQDVMAGSAPSTPYVQTYDLANFQSVSKHALARTSPTDNNINNQGYPITEPTVTKIAYSRNGTWLASIDEWQPPERDLQPLANDSEDVAELCQERREVHLMFWRVDADPAEPFKLTTRVNQPHHTTRAESVIDLASDPISSRFATIGNDGNVKLWTPRVRVRDGLTAEGPDGKPMKAWTCSQVIALAEPVCEHVERLSDRSQNGAVAFSEDGSVLFAAFGGPSGAIVYMIDAATGTIRDRLYDLFTGEVRGMAVLSSSLVMLSDDLTVYDVVSDELRYGYSLRETLGSASRLVQLAANHESKMFAVAVPLLTSQNKHVVDRTTQSELTVFSIDDSHPVFVQTFPRVITSVVPTAKSTGFVAIDSEAQVWSLTEGTEALPVVQSLAELNLDEENEPVQEPLAQITNGMEDGGSDEEMQDAAQDGEVEDYEVHATVVPPQRLAEVFDAAPAFAMPLIEDVFYQVARLYAGTAA